MCLDAIPTTDLFDTFTKTLCVGYDNMPLIFNFMVGRLGIVSAPIIDLSGRLVESFLHLVQSPFGVFAFGFLVDDKGVIHIPVPELGGMEAVLRAFCSKYSM